MAGTPLGPERPEVPTDGTASADSGSWGVSVQQRSGTTWKTVWTGRTRYVAETASVNVARGTYRAWSAPDSTGTPARPCPTP